MAILCFALSFSGLPYWLKKQGEAYEATACCCALHNLAIIRQRRHVADSMTLLISSSSLNLFGALIVQEEMRNKQKDQRKCIFSISLVLYVDFPLPYILVSLSKGFSFSFSCEISW